MIYPPVSFTYIKNQIEEAIAVETLFGRSCVSIVYTYAGHVKWIKYKSSEKVFFNLQSVNLAFHFIGLILHF